VKRKMLTANFRSDEFDCNCLRDECDAPPMRQEFMQHLQELRNEWAKPLIPTSGSRCVYYNSMLKDSSPYSQHLLGNAVDFVFTELKEMDAFVALAEKYRFRGIGKGGGKVHLDDRKYGIARWEYK
jgi:uncharacterized protein YcbK (DUF882 family)